MTLSGVAYIKAELQSRGVRLESALDTNSVRVRRGGAGPAEGITLAVNGSPASVPFSVPFAAASPFLLTLEGDRWVLLRQDRAGVRPSANRKTLAGSSPVHLVRGDEVRGEHRAHTARGGESGIRGELVLSGGLGDKGGCGEPPRSGSQGERIGIRVRPLPVAPYYGKETREGVPYKQIALLHGLDCLASTVLQSCAYWGTPSGCAFCGIGLSWQAGKTLLRKEPGDLAEAAVAAQEDGARHVTLTAGSTKDRRLELASYRDAVRAIVEAAGLPTHVQLMPPVGRACLESLREAGVVSVGIHAETFDRDLLAKIAPGKACLQPEAYLECWREAVDVFGRGQVESFLLMGLGEEPESLLEGCETLAQLGVYPYLVPFRPIPDTPLAGRHPLDPETAAGLYQRAARILDQHGIDWADALAGCVRCRGCSALPDFQDALAAGRLRRVRPERLEWEVARDGVFVEVAAGIRHEVFVEEQGFSPSSEEDGLDRISVHIVARQGSRALGSVRITPLGEDLWLGSRLAVKAGFRGGLGASLVRRAEEEVLRRAGKRFIAYIQRPRVGFFERCGWRSLEEIPSYHGRPHTLMAAAGRLWGEFGLGRVSAEAVARAATRLAGRGRE